MDLTRSQVLEIEQFNAQGYRNLIEWLLVRKGIELEGNKTDDALATIMGITVESVRIFLSTKGLIIRLVGKPSSGYDYYYKGIFKKKTYPFDSRPDAEIAAVINAFKYL